MINYSENILAELSREGSELVWMVELNLEPISYLSVTDYTQGSGDSFTLTITYTDLSTETKVYTETTNFSAVTSNEVTAQNIALAIQTDTDINDFVSAFAFGAIIGIVGKPFDNRNPTHQIAKLEVTTISDAWEIVIPALGNRIDDPDAGPPYRFMTGSNAADLRCHDPFAFAELSEVRNVSAQIDPMTRQFSIGDIEIEFEDREQRSAIRNLIYRTLPRGRRVDVFLGCTTLTIPEFVPVGSFLIREVIPSLGAITMTCSELTTVLVSSDFTKRRLPTEVLVKANTSGSGMTLTVTWVTNGGVDGSQVLTQGGSPGWPDGVTQVHARDIADAWNGTGHEDIIHAGWDGDVSAVFWPTTSFTTIATGNEPIWENRVASIRIISSDTSLIETFDEIDTIHFSGNQYTGVAPSKTTCTSAWPPELALHVMRSFGITNIDTGTFLQSNHSDISHLSISAHEWHNMLIEDQLVDNSISSNKESALDFISRLLFLCQGGLWTDETGQMAFLRRDDPSRTSVITLAEDDWEEFEWLEQYQTAINKINVYGIGFGTSSAGKLNLVNAQDTGSLILMSAFGNVNPDVVSFDSYLMGNFVQMSDDSVDNLTELVGDLFDIPYCFREGFSGCRVARTWDQTQDTLDQISAIRPAYYVIWHPQSGNLEIVASNVTAVPSGPMSLYTNESPGGHHLFGWSSTDIRLGNDGTLIQLLMAYKVQDNWNIQTTARGQLGTVPVSWRDVVIDSGGGPVFIADCTIAKRVADHHLAFAYGVPMAKFRTSLRFIGLQLGDVITHFNNQYLNFLVSGADPQTTWEIVSKEIDYPWIVFTIARLTANNTGTYRAYRPPSESRGTNRIQFEVITTTDLIPVTDTSFNVLTRN